MAIHFLHGVIDGWSAGQWSHRLYGSRERFVRFLRERTRYGRWGDRDDVLSVDDATRAGAEACRVAREEGHEVIFFINALQAATGLPYFFSLLDAHLEARTLSDVEWNGERWPLRDRGDVRRLRRAAKAVLMRMTPEDANAAANELGRAGGSPLVEPPEFARPVTADELRELRDLGVRIENHGWSHVEIDALDDDAFARHLHGGRDWLRRELGVEATLYAVPFGLTDVSASRLPLLDDDYFLADESRAQGEIAPRGWNRMDITGELQER